MTALCSGKICTIFPEKGALNFWKACTIALEYSTKCGLKNYCLTGLLNVTDPKTCKLERILFEHDNAVFRYLFVKDYNRIKKYLKILKDYNLEKSDWLLKLEQEVDACTQ